MKLKEQKELIKKIVNSDKPNQECKEFKKLQMHWYNKLEEKTNYNDIERIGTQRHQYYDEYHGLIKHYSWSITDNYSFSAHQYYQLLRKISWDAIVTSNSVAFDPSKPYKTHNLADLLPSEAKNALQHSTSLSPDSKTSIKTQKLSLVDSRILRLAGNGKTYREISKYLRRYLSKQAKNAHKNPKRKPFSVYYVHTRFKKLLNDIKAGHIFVDCEGGGVEKSGEELNSYIYTENNND